jgi:hypothetical protein
MTEEKKIVSLKASMQVEAGTGPKKPRTRTLEELAEFARTPTCGKCKNLEGDRQFDKVVVRCSKGVWQRTVPVGILASEIEEFFIDRSDCEFFEPSRYAFR